MVIQEQNPRLAPSFSPSPLLSVSSKLVRYYTHHAKCSCTQHFSVMRKIDKKRKFLDHLFQINKFLDETLMSRLINFIFLPLFTFIHQHHHAQSLSLHKRRKEPSQAKPVV